MPINSDLLADLGAKAPGMQRMILVLALSSVAGGGGAAAAVGTPTFFLVVGAETFTAVQGISQLSEADKEMATIMMATTQLEKSGTIDPSKVHFSQDSIGLDFKDSSKPNVDALANGLKDGSIDSKSIPPIKVTVIDGKIYTLDNRRLYAFQQAGMPIN